MQQPNEIAPAQQQPQQMQQMQQENPKHEGSQYTEVNAENIKDFM